MQSVQPPTLSARSSSEDGSGDDDAVGCNNQLMEDTKKLASSISDDAKQAANIIENLKAKIESFAGDDDADREGISLLHLKNLQMVDYMTNLLYLMLKKSQGKSISGDGAIERIVESRTVLEKMRPMEKKLKYQMDKFIRLADNSGNDAAIADDPLHFKPNLQSLADDDDDEDDDDSDDDNNDKKDDKKDKKYVVPKHVPTLPDDDLTRQEMEAEEGRKAKKKTLSKSIMEDLKRQYMDTPEEEFNAANGDQMRAKHVAEMRERTRYEEDNYMRLPEMSKKEKHKLRKKSMTTVHTVANELTYFGSNNFFNEAGSGGQQRKRKSGGGGGRGGKKGSAKKKFKRM